MTRKLVVVMDSGRFKAYRWEESPQFSNPRLELLEDRDTEVTRRISDQVSDQAGQFPKGSLSFASISDMSNGERHTLDLELRRRALRQSAARISDLLGREEVDGCYLAAGSEINHAVIEALEPRTREKIQKNVMANLTRLDTAEIIRHFQAAGK